MRLEMKGGSRMPGSSSGSGSCFCERGGGFFSSDINVSLRTCKMCDPFSKLAGGATLAGSLFSKRFTRICPCDVAKDLAKENTLYCTTVLYNRLV